MEPSQCSPALNASQGITANADISGIGVRTAVYTQVVISLIHPLIAGYDGKIDDFEMRSLSAVYLGILLPGCALLLSAIVQAKTFGLSAYHAMIVLFLSWINNTSAFTFFAYILVNYIHGDQCRKEMTRRNNREQEITELDRKWAEAPNPEKWGILEKVEKILDALKLDKNGTKSTSLNRGIWELEIQQWSLWRKKKIMAMFPPNQGDSLGFQRRWEKEWEDNKREQETILQKRPSGVFGWWGQLFSHRSVSLTGALASAHLTMLSAFGWWFWSTLPNFGINQECVSSIHLAFFTKSIPITSTVLRSLSKFVYILSSLPVINVAIWMPVFFLGVVVLLLVLSPLIACALSIWEIRSESVLGRGRKSPSRRWGNNPLYPRIFFNSAIITTLVLQILFVLLTEFTIAHNQPLIQSGEGDWTFGQTLALALALIPLTEVVKFLWEKRPQAPKESREGTETEVTGHTGETGEIGEARESEKFREAQESGERTGDSGMDDLV